LDFLLEAEALGVEVLFRLLALPQGGDFLFGDFFLITGNTLMGIFVSLVVEV
jgi:hypothetical protein